MPLTIAWSTPGAAVLVSAGQVTTAAGRPRSARSSSLRCWWCSPGCGRAWAGWWPPSRPHRPGHARGHPARSVPDTGVGGGRVPARVAPILAVWLVTFALSPRWAIVAAFATAMAVVSYDADHRCHAGDPLASFEAGATIPTLTWSAAVSIAIPLYIVTMAAQNVPGVAIASSYGYTVPWRPALTATGWPGAAAAPFGAHAVNLAAITAALPASGESHPDPAQRWRTSATLGMSYLVLGVITSADQLPVRRTTRDHRHRRRSGPAGHARIVAARRACRRGGGPARRLPHRGGHHLRGRRPGTTIAGISSSFWALIAGLIVYGITGCCDGNSRTDVDTEAAEYLGARLREVQAAEVQAGAPWRRAAAPIRWRGRYRRRARPHGPPDRRIRRPRPAWPRHRPGSPTPTAIPSCEHWPAR